MTKHAVVSFDQKITCDTVVRVYRCNCNIVIVILLKRISAQTAPDSRRGLDHGQRHLRRPHSDSVLRVGLQGSKLLLI